jgi:hypothetical protein
MSGAPQDQENSTDRSVEHWDRVYATKAESTLGWYEADFSTTLNFLGEVPIAGKRIFLAGVGLSGVARKLAERGGKVILNDLSRVAIEKLIARDHLDDFAAELAVGDLGSIDEEPRIATCDVWLDRAVLHFIYEDANLAAYFKRVRASVALGGYAMFAEFAPGGATKCSNLPTKQYSPADLAERLGSDFSLVRAQETEYVTPGGNVRPYTFALFHRVRVT